MTALVLPASAVAGPIPDPNHPELSSRVAELAEPSLRDASPAKQADAVDLPVSGPASIPRVGDRLVVEIRFDRGAASHVDELRAAGARSRT